MTKNKPITIGFLVPNLMGDYHVKLWKSLNKSAIKKNVNLIIFTPFMFYDQRNYKNEHFKTFKLAGPENIDGLIISAGSINVFCKVEELKKIFNYYYSLPIVSIAGESTKIPSVLSDNKQDMHDFIEHFVSEHGYSNIAFIRGPQNNQEAEARFNAYKAVHKKYGLIFNNKLVLDGDFNLQTGQRLVSKLLDQKDIKVDAIIAANDDMILGALSELQNRGIKVPQEIALGGFDDIEAVKYSNPPISSVKQSFSEQSERAMEMMLDLIKGKDVPLKQVIPAEFVFRESCGCGLKSKITKTIASINSDKLKNRTQTFKNTEKGYEIGNITSFYNSVINKRCYEDIYKHFEILLPRVHIPSCCIVVFNEGLPFNVQDKNYPPSKSKIDFSFYDYKRNYFKEKMITTANLIPWKDFFKKKRRTLICSGLSFHNNHFGYIIYEIASGIDPLVLHLIILQLTSCLQSIYIHKELDEAFDKLKELDKAKTNFFANISHELRTPLSLIRLPVKDIMDNMYGKEINSQNRIFKIIYRQVSILEKYINMLVDFSKIEYGKIQLNRRAVNIAKLMDLYVSDFKVRAKAENKYFFVKKLIKGIVYILIDNDYFQRAIYNLLDNAFKFTDEGGTITLKLSESNNNIVISIIDTGIGIPEGKLKIIFDRFEQVEMSSNRKYEGMGIGLPYAKEIIELHSGKIKVRSVLGKYSCFSVQLPIYKHRNVLFQNDFTEVCSINRSPDLIIPSECKVEYPFSNNKNTLLLVEDNKDMINYLYSRLIKKYNIFKAYNGKEGLKVLKRNRKTDLIITDVMMPIMDGKEFFYHVRDNPEYGRVPFIFLTARADEEEKIEGIKDGAIDYIIKPFSVYELEAKIESIIVNNQKQVNYLLKEFEYFLKDNTIKNSFNIFIEKCERFHLSDKEIEIVKRTMEGLQNKEIACELNLSTKTVSNHLSNIYRKTGVSNRTELIMALNKL